MFIETNQTMLHAHFIYRLIKIMVKVSQMNNMHILKLRHVFKIGGSILILIISKILRCVILHGIDWHEQMYSYLHSDYK